MSVAPVLAAGGVVWRWGGACTVEVLVVHRPKYDDWSLPKGKLEEGQTAADAALREVAEETGWRCRLGDELPGATYRDRQGRPKVVRYWTMHAVAGRFEANAEVDQIRWLPLDEAMAVLSYGSDRAALAALPALVHR